MDSSSIFRKNSGRKIISFTSSSIIDVFPPSGRNLSQQVALVDIPIDPPSGFRIQNVARSQSHRVQQNFSTATALPDSSSRDGSEVLLSRCIGRKVVYREAGKFRSEAEPPGTDLLKVDYSALLVERRRLTLLSLLCTTLSSTMGNNTSVRASKLILEQEYQSPVP
jgi:hypothetical protein